VYAERGEYPQAIRDVSKAIDLEPRNAQLYFLRGKLKRDNKDDWNAVMSDFERSCELVYGLGCCEISAMYYEEALWAEDDASADKYMEKSKNLIERAERIGADEEECKGIFEQHMW